MIGSSARILLFTVITALLLLKSVAAAQTAAPPEAYKISADVTMLNNEARMPGSEKIITAQLLDYFNVRAEQIQALAMRNIEFGDVAAILAFAETIPGGLSGESISETLKIWQTSTGWDQVAGIFINRFNINISDVAGKIAVVEDDAHTEIKSAIAESFAGQGAGGTGAGGEQNGATRYRILP